MLKEELMTLEDVFAFPTSFAQRRLWFLDRLRPGDPTYNLAAAVRLQGRLDIPALQRALNDLARRHESLRTTFAVIDGAPRQIVASSAKLTLSVVDLREFPEAERELRFQELADEEAQWSFDLAHGPLIRMKLLRTDEQAHVLLLTMHHIISDGWSIGVFISELSALYESFTSGGSASLPELSIQYADYAVWQHEWLQGEILDQQLSYWKRQLAGAPNVLELPADRQRPPVQTFRSASVSSELSTSLSGSLKSMSGKNGATLYMTLLAAFNLLLHRYTGQDDILVGSPIAGRNRAEVKGLIGFFLNTLVLRTKLDGAPSFRELLGRVRESTVGAYSHQDLPFERLLEDLQPERDLSRTPLFQVFFNMLNLPTAEIQLPGLSVELLPPRDVGAKFDLTLYVRELNHRIFFDLVFNADLFTRERMAEMLRQYTRLLSQAVENPEQRINEFSLVTPAAEKHLPSPAEPLNGDWRGAVHTIFSKRAQDRPERLAVIDRHEKWTYGVLDALSNQLANCLRGHGIRNEDIVVIYGHRSSSLVWALMGVMKAGGAFIILDPSYPTSRLVDYLELAQPKGFIHLEAAGALPEELEKYVTSMAGCFCLKLPRRKLALAQNVLAGYSRTNPDLTIRPDDLAYISFTSGSTGKPKGVEGMHGSLSHFIPWLQRTFDLNETDRYTMLSGLAHDPLHRDIFTPLQTGACICIPEQEDIEAPGRIAEWMSQEEVTVAHLTPAMAQLLTETGAKPAGRQVRTLRYAFLVGDVLTKRDVARLRRLAPSINCINYYGSTETQRAVSYFRATNEPAADADSQMRSKEILPLGKGIEDVQLLVLNSASRLAGIGETGEIYLRSPHIARGYLRDMALTGERFIINPFTKIAGDRLYRTGDLGRYLPDGNVEPLGRADHQVKIRGFRIELGEVEACLGTHPGVREAVAILREDVLGEKRLAAYIVPHTDSAPSAEDLRESLKAKLPDYMVPTAYVFLEALPLTPNKKIDRRALMPPPPSEPEGETSYVAARSSLEKKVALIWSEILKLERVGIHNNFFEMGGHSLLAIRLIARLHEEFKVDLPLRKLFEAPTVADVAAQIEAIHQTQALSPAPVLKPISRKNDLPLSFAQQRLWFIDQLEPGNPAYNIFAGVKLSGRLDEDALGRSINEIFRRHELLRTSFKESGERPIQVIAPSLQVTLPVTDLSRMPETERQGEITRLAIEESRAPFDLTRAPLLRISLLKLGEEERVLLLSMHHIISDGWSMGLLLREVISLYEAFSHGDPSPLAELPAQYADFSYWQREWLQGAALENQLDYWRKQLANAPSLIDLPADHPRPAAPSHQGARQSRQFPVEVYEALKSLSLSEGVTIFVTLLAAFKTLLHCYTGQDDLVIGSPIAGRKLIETESIIGCFANTLVMRSDLSGNPTFRELLNRVREMTLDAYAHQDAPFEKLVQELQPKRHTSHTPFFQVSFSLQTSTEVLEVPGLEMSPLIIDNGAAMFDLVLNMKQTMQGLTGTMEYRACLFNPGTINRMLGNYEMLLNRIIARPDAKLRELEESLIQADWRNMAAQEAGRKETSWRNLKKTGRKKVSEDQRR